MGIYLNPKNTGFRESVRSEIYVDKSRLIEYTNKVIGTEQKYICISRPRRFGKSMTAKMLAAYYSKGCDSLSLFQPLRISAFPGFPDHLNHYPVILLNMQYFLGNAGEEGNAETWICHIQNAVCQELLTEYGALLPSSASPLQYSLPDLLEAIHDLSGEQFFYPG